MNRRVKAEKLILKSNKYFAWMITGFILLIAYNVFSIAMDMQVQVSGGYYAYTVMMLACILGAVIPMAAGAFLGGFDGSTQMLEYRMTTQTSLQWLLSKLILLVEIVFICIVALNTAGIVLDILKGNVCGDMQQNIFLLAERLILTSSVWLFWGLLCFTISLLTKSPGVGILLGIAVFFGEQYIEQYIRIPFGIMWNIKSMEHYFFDNSSVPFGVVQSSYNTLLFSIGYTALLILLCIVIDFLYFKGRFPQK